MDLRSEITLDTRKHCYPRRHCSQCILFDWFLRKFWLAYHEDSTFPDHLSFGNTYLWKSFHICWNQHKLTCCRNEHYWLWWISEANKFHQILIPTAFENENDAAEGTRDIYGNSVNGTKTLLDERILILSQCVNVRSNMMKKWFMKPLRSTSSGQLKRTK